MGSTVAFPMLVKRFPFRYQPLQFGQQIVPDIRIGILIDGQSCRGMLREDMADAAGKIRRRQRCYLSGNIDNFTACMRTYNDYTRRASTV